MMTTSPLPVNAGQARDRNRSRLCLGKVPRCTGRYSVIGTAIVNSAMIRLIILLGSFRSSGTVVTRIVETVAAMAIVARLSRGSVRSRRAGGFEVAVDNLVDWSVSRKPPLLYP
jgi:hypothetical protein